MPKPETAMESIRRVLGSDGLLIAPTFSHGHLRDSTCLEFPDDMVYVLGDVYPYYEGKLGYDIEGKIYIVKKS